MKQNRLTTRIGCALAACALATVAHAVQTDLATVPLITSAPQTVKPNVLFVLDDSGSMDWSFMPDDAGSFDGFYGFPSAQCNGVYYNPTITYRPPVTSAGVSYPASSFTNAWNNGYNTGAGTVDLSTNFQGWNASNSGGGTAAYYYTYSGTQTTAALKDYQNTAGQFFQECSSNVGSPPGSSVFTQLIVSATSGPGATDERTNFANWYSYYRTRMLMMKSSAGLAFQSIDSQYRVGYMTINNNQGSAFLNLATFDVTGKSNWYAKLYGAVPNRSTPLRLALAKAGRIYANKLTSVNGVAVTDPVQYSCQRNVTLLSTDGYWNESNTIPQIDGSTAIGNQDSTETRPFNDGTANNGGTSDTLADVAEYYYKTDLRTAGLGNNIGALGADVSANNVVPSGDDLATWQHMTTFTLGLGARGRMIFSPTYKTDATGDYSSVLKGSPASSTACTWLSSGTVCDWPIPGSNLPENIDDLWHAAVNGRGTYFSATDPASLSVGLANALGAINAMTSDASAATTSNPNVTQGANFIFSSTFRSVDWFGEFERRAINTTNGQPAATPEWQAAALLDANLTRTLYTFDGTNATTHLKPFLWANLTAAEQAYFSTPYIASLSQFCAVGNSCLSASNQTAASGSRLLNFIRGDRTNEGVSNDTSKYFRHRRHVLGDIVNSEAVYVQAPQFSYADAGYGAFKTSNATRTPMVYVGANDGMVHAFNADTAANGGGTEVWAYVPKTVMPNLYKLADKNYSTQHQYYVDGSPTQADVYFSGAWHTIIVGGFNAGGQGYYAIDVTVPSSPKVLWEINGTSAGFANLGYTYGRPEIAKLKDGTWAVFLTSGYNNILGDGKGYLYVLNAGAGTAITTIGTGQGSATSTVAGVCSTAPCPSGLAQIRAYVDNANYDNTTQRVYGGDLFGNVWRFDVNNVGLPTYGAQLLATLKDGSGNAQPVTARPELGKVAGYNVAYVGTGRYLGATDLSDVSGQSFYAIKDNLGSTSLGNPRAVGANFVQQTLTAGFCPVGSAYCTAGTQIRTGSSLGVNFATNNGWFVDLPVTGERSTTDPQLALGTLAVTTNILNSSACSAGGSSYVNFFDYRTGAAISTASGLVSFFLGDPLHPALATRPVQLRFADGTVRSLIRMSDGTWQEPLTPIPPSPNGLRRTSWRELVTQ